MAAADTQPVTKKRDIALNRMRSKYPEKNFDDDEAFFGQINDDYDNYDKQIADRDSQIEEYKGREKTFSDMFTSDPRSASFLTDWRNGEDPVVSLIRRYGTDIVDVINDPEKQEEIAKANKEYADRNLKEKGYEEEYAKNLDESANTVDAVAQEMGWDEEQKGQALEFLINTSRDVMLGKFTREALIMAHKALNHDADVENAGLDGEVRGRNAKIDEKLRRSKKGDGTMPLGGKNGTAPAVRDSRDLGALDRYDDGVSNIWERGGEKRTKY